MLGNVFIMEDIIMTETKKSGTIIWIVALIICFITVIPSCIGSCSRAGSGSGSAYDDIKTCSSCHRKFDWNKDPNNAKSISYHGMCTSCYENYKSAQGMLGRDEFGNPK